MAVGKNIMGKRERGINIISHIISRLLGRISSGEEDDNFGKKIKICKFWVGE